MTETYLQIVVDTKFIFSSFLKSVLFPALSVVDYFLLPGLLYLFCLAYQAYLSVIFQRFPGSMFPLKVLCFCVSLDSVNFEFIVSSLLWGLVFLGLLYISGPYTSSVLTEDKNSYFTFCVVFVIVEITMSICYNFCNSDCPFTWRVLFYLPIIMEGNFLPFFFL